MKKICTVYRSPKHEGMYLYVEKSDGLQRVPEELLQRFGTPQQAMTLVLHSERKLARADINKVLAALDQQGFYLQLPPQQEEYTRDVREKNSKLY